MTSTLPCLDSFTTEFLTDIGVPPSDIVTVKKYGNIAIQTYEENAPQTTPTDIAIQLYGCGQVEVNKIVKDIADEAIILQIALSIIILVIAIVISCAFILTTGLWRVSIICIMIVIGIISFYMLYTNAQANIDALLVRREQRLKVCVSTAEKQIEQYETEQLSAINSALCAYANQS